METLKDRRLTLRMPSSIYKKLEVHRQKAFPHLSMNALIVNTIARELNSNPGAHQNERD